MSNNEHTAKRLFSSSIGGYNKQDVNEYIAKLNSQFASIEDDYKKNIESQKKEISLLNAENETLRAKLVIFDDLESKLSQTRNQLVDAKEKIGECDSLIASYRVQLENSENELAETKNALSVAHKSEKDAAARLEQSITDSASLTLELASAKEKIVELEAALAASNADLVSCNEEKAKLYDEISGKIGTMMITAQAEAERITSEALSRSNEMITDAKQKSEETLRRTGELGSDMIREFESITQSYAKRMRDELTPESSGDPTISSDILESTIL